MKKNYIKPIVNITAIRLEHHLAQASTLDTASYGNNGSNTNPNLDNQEGDGNDVGARSFTFWEESWEEDY